MKYNVSTKQVSVNEMMKVNGGVAFGFDPYNEVKAPIIPIVVGGGK